MITDETEDGVKEQIGWDGNTISRRFERDQTRRELT